VTQLLVRNLSESVKARLRQRAKRHGHSMEEEARNILSAAVAKESSESEGLGTKIASYFKKCGFKDGEIKEIHGYFGSPARFDD